MFGGSQPAIAPHARLPWNSSVSTFFLSGWVQPESGGPAENCLFLSALVRPWAHGVTSWAYLLDGGLRGQPLVDWSLRQVRLEAGILTDVSIRSGKAFSHPKFHPSSFSCSLGKGTWYLLPTRDRRVGCSFVTPRIGEERMDGNGNLLSTEQGRNQECGKGKRSEKGVGREKGLGEEGKGPVSRSSQGA